MLKAKQSQLAIVDAKNYIPEFLVYKKKIVEYDFIEEK